MTELQPNAKKRPAGDDLAGMRVFRRSSSEEPRPKAARLTARPSSGPAEPALPPCPPIGTRTTIPLPQNAPRQVHSTDSGPSSGASNPSSDDDALASPKAAGPSVGSSSSSTCPASSSAVVGSPALRAIPPVEMTSTQASASPTATPVARRAPRFSYPASYAAAYSAYPLPPTAATVVPAPSPAVAACTSKQYIPIPGALHEVVSRFRRIYERKPSPELQNSLQRKIVLGHGHDPQRLVYAAELDGMELAVKCQPVRGHRSGDEAEYHKMICLELGIPGVVRLHDVYFDEASKDRRLLLVMERMGGSVEDLLRSRHKDFTEGVIVRIVRQVLDVLEPLHQHGLVHLDLKPENLLFCRSGHRTASREQEVKKAQLSTLVVKLADLGCMDTVKNEGTAQRGDFVFMAPEVYSERPRTTKSDIWSLGITTLYLMEGRKCFRDQQWNSKLQREVLTCSGVIPRPTEPTKWSKELLRFVRRCLTRSPEHRPDAGSLLLDPLFA